MMLIQTMKTTLNMKNYPHNMNAQTTDCHCLSCVPPRYGVTPGSNVALLVVPSAEFTLLQLAIIKLGAT
jgi:hypothetical protein